MTQNWTEFGATWNCPNDLNTENHRPDCGGTGWNMNAKKKKPLENPWVDIPTDVALITNETTDTVSYNVTSDVAEFLADTQNNGWIIKKDEEGKSGWVEFGSRESAVPPILKIVYRLDE